MGKTRARKKSVAATRGAVRMAKAKTRKTKASNAEAPADQDAAATPLEIEQGRRRLHDFLKFWRVCRGKAASAPAAAAAN
jgi:hypothetical protein